MNDILSMLVRPLSMPRDSCDRITVDDIAFLFTCDAAFELDFLAIKGPVLNRELWRIFALVYGSCDMAQ
jgi:hypothetical protein